jgi:HAD superfamily hydrolase (TIGR01459 family)
MAAEIAGPDGPARHADLRELVARFDGFLIDVWGVLHSGVAPFPGVVDGMAGLRQAGRHVVLITNSSRRAAQIVEHLAGLGIGQELYDAVVSSGEVAYRMLGRFDHPLLAGRGRRCLAIGAPYAEPWLEELGLEAADEASADFVLLTSLEKSAEPIATARRRLERARARDLPLICANPDRVVRFGDGLFTECGQLAFEYAEAGGRVAMLGKPHPVIYAEAVQALRALGATQMLAVGDSLETDVRGARAYGLEVALIPASGIHREQLALDYGELPGDAAIRPLFERYGVAPDYLLAGLRWG